MNLRREVACPSGAILRIQLAPFAVSKSVYKAVLKQLEQTQFLASQDVAATLKNLICGAFSSELVESCLLNCMKSCTYDDGRGEVKITEATFEPLEARKDYIFILLEVAQDNIAPFLSSLYAELPRVMGSLNPLFDSQK